MPSRRPRKSISLAIKLAELSAAASQVVAHRVTRMALAGQKPSVRDQREFDLMVSEKKAAFSQSWGAMAVQAAHANQVLAWPISNLNLLHTTLAAMGGAPQLAGAAIVFADKLPLHEGLNPANPGLRFKQHTGGRVEANCNRGQLQSRPIATETQAAAH